MTEQLAWYVARASGIVAMILVTLAVSWGLLFTTRLLQGRPSPKWLLDLHRFLGTLSVVFSVIHLGGLVADSYVHFGVVELLVPMASEWQPEPVAWGVAAFYLLLAVQGTSLVMKRLPRRLWRGVHFASYAMFWAGVVHGVRAGTDAGTPAFVWGTTGAVLLVVFLTAFRVLAVRKKRRPAARASAVRPDPPQRGRVGQRIAVDQEEVGGAAHRDRPGTRLPKEVAASPGDGSQSLPRLQTALHQAGHLPGEVTGPDAASAEVAPPGDGDAGGVGDPGGGVRPLLPVEEAAALAEPGDLRGVAEGQP